MYIYMHPSDSKWVFPGLTDEDYPILPGLRFSVFPAMRMRVMLMRRIVQHSTDSPPPPPPP